MPQEDSEFGEPEFLGWLLLKRLKEQSDNQISRSKFLKLCCITDRHLAESHEYEVGLPRYWYMYGELANEHEFSGRFYNAPLAIGWDGQQYIPKELPVEAFEVSEAGLEVIPDAVDWTVREFGRKNVEEIKQHQYEEYAENEFIRQYSELRWLLSTIDLGKQERLQNYGSGGESNEEYLKRQLDEMMAAYPGNEERYDEMKSLYFRWDDTVRLMVDQSTEYSRIAEFLDDFILVLSKEVLRFVYNQNISEERLLDWEEDAAEEREEFTATLRDVRSELLQERSRSTELDRVSDAYSQTIDEQIDQLLGQE
ncbi:hypothetical protein [Halorientalis pallida]|uniref:Uncharacterized protein n=1 Tax=Halorientalis pallida TaxID=2479928 RepID=A0A498KU62_9EURY|nr:hypothetical protein [Halorientalis pallida]RXK47784.1 hypothetical protein EAF64_14120 [Halorientalis pallida]